MSLIIEQTQPVPLVSGEDGLICIAGTRVTLDSVAFAFERGATAEEIAQQYPSLALADVYSVIGYILRHQAAVAAYLAESAKNHEAVRDQNERQFPAQGIRERLLARRGA